MIKSKKGLDINDFSKILLENNPFIVDHERLGRVKQSFDFLTNFAKDKVIYGVNTGLGPMAQFKINETDKIQLQYNLIRSHATGTGKPLDPIDVKAAMLARLNTLCLGYSGVHPSVVTLMQELINRGITPLIYEHGGVGASGDLVQLAHLALVLIGEGEVFYKGKKMPTKQLFEQENLQAIQVQLREGLAIMNGTSVMTGIGIVNILKAKHLLHWVVACSAAINEIVAAYDDHLSHPLNHSKQHQGQQFIAKKMRQHLSDSQLVKKRTQHLYKKTDTASIFKAKVQEYYSLRCVPQILGPIWDTLENVEAVLMAEVNSANDNPIVDIENQQVYHGGNFHGDYVALEMDKLKLVITKMTMLSERQLNYLLNNKLNEVLPPFINLGVLGLNLGVQGMQFTATSTTAENQMLSNPMYIHSIPNNNDNQDIVSMGTNAALTTKKVIENAYQVLAIQSIAIAQAIDALGCLEKASTPTKALYHAIRTILPTFKQDIVLYPYIHQVKDYISKHSLENVK